MKTAYFSFFLDFFTGLRKNLLADNSLLDKENDRDENLLQDAAEEQGKEEDKAKERKIKGRGNRR